MANVWIGAPMRPDMQPLGNDALGNPVMVDSTGVQTLMPASHLFKGFTLMPWQAKAARNHGLPMVIDESEAER